MAIAPTVNFDIYMAGDVAIAKQVCREFCFEQGFCVSVTPTHYIYTGGEETGFRVGIINYPRFPLPIDELKAKTLALAELLQSRLFQNSYSIVGPTETLWHTRRVQ
jgi:hypothetical protein